MRKLTLALNLTVFTLLFISAELNAQFLLKLTNPEVRGDEAFEVFNYEEAAHFYQQALQLDSANQNLQLKLAESYYKESDYKNASKWYGAVLENPQIEVANVYKLRYAQSLMAIDRVKKADYWYHEHHKGDTLRQTENRIIGIEQYDDFFASKNTVEVKRLEINSPYRDYSPVYYKRGILFVSERPNTLLFKTSNKEPKYEKLNYSDLYYAEYRIEGYFEEPEILGSSVNTNFHEGPVAPYSNDNKIAFTRNNYLKRRINSDGNGVNMLEIFFATKNEHDHWDDIVGFSNNNENYSSAHPTLDNAGSLLVYASSRPGGYGGSDLYYCTMEADSTWSKPTNLGPGINTEGNELFPTLDRNVLYFASDGHPGLGGLDIYKAKFDFETSNEIENLGVPINSPGDDFGITIDPTGNKGYFSSNRADPLNDDIYAFSRVPVSAYINIVDSRTGEKIDKAKVAINLNENESKTWDYDGRKIKLGSVLNRNHRVIITSDKYFEREVKIEMGMNNPRDVREFDIAVKRKPMVMEDSVQLIMNGKQIFMAFNGNVYIPSYGTNVSISDGLHSIPLGFSLYEDERNKLPSKLIQEGFKLKTPLVVDNIYYATNFYELRPQDEKVLDEFIDVMKAYDELKLFVNSHADSRGSKEYNLMLSEKRAQAAYDYLVQGGIDQDRLKMLFFGEHVPENDCIDGVNCDDADYQKNRKSEFGFFVERAEF
ncbi:OmpA family protein [Reichenbachiella ulvae]|uniref:OmpA family protein n=1 Tax=Reichenbachiella ulvae TaxID=2980104 RepID=A0ABT3CTC3_9BACT|nr:OmpA family protein [Reichenbachiella ulvae]MCV9386960.1 OmpA family protein [Reichenbachiella ulvae]